MKQFILLSTMICIAFASDAKIWRVNNNPGVMADFTDMPAVFAVGSGVNNDDTIHVEASITRYSAFTMNKRLVIIGTGYFLSGANSNPGLQANTNPASLEYCFLDTLASSSQFIGIEFSDGIYTTSGQGADNITLTRCKLNQISIGFASPSAGADFTGWVINKCYILSSIAAINRPVKNAAITNTFLGQSFDLSHAGNLNNLVRNNVFRSTITTYNSYFSNNIINGSTGFTATNSTVKNNTCIGAAPAGFIPFVGSNGNVAGETDANTFLGLAGNSTDGQWRLKAGSQAIGTGETINSITPDRGAFGTDDPYVLSGIAPIPTIYSLTVPATVPSSASTMQITISTKSNN
jgi:hypothetical protein